MKFYQTIASIVFCIMYSVTIFGSEAATLPNALKNIATRIGVDYPCCLSEDLLSLIMKHKGNDIVYKEITHVKQYPSSLRELVSSPLIADRYDNPGAYSVEKKFDIISLFTIGTSFLAAWNVKWKLSAFLKKLSNSKKEKIRTIFESDWFALSIKSIIPTPCLSFLPFYLFERLIVKLSKPYTHILLPKYVKINNDRHNPYVCVQDNSLFLTREGKKFYRTETRNLPDMFGGGYYDELPSRNIREKLYPSPRIVIEKDLTYKLENGEVNIYSPKNNETPETFLGSLSIQTVTAFDVSDSEKMIVTVGEDGIRQWALQENPES